MGQDLIIKEVIYYYDKYMEDYVSSIYWVVLAEEISFHKFFTIKSCHITISRFCFADYVFINLIFYSFFKNIYQEKSIKIYEY